MRRNRLSLIVFTAAACGTSGTETMASGPCELRLEPGVQLELADGARIPDPAKTVVRDSRGFVYTASTPGGRIAVFTAEGRFLRTIGRPGEGPGEIGAGRYNAVMIHRDTLYVTRPVAYDLFDTAGAFIRRLKAPSVPTLLAQAIQLTSKGEILTGTQDPQLQNFFAVLSRDGSSRRTFGAMSEIDKQYGQTLGAIRVIAYDGRDSFWAGPRTYYPDGLKLEKWSVSSGHMIDSIRLDVPWYPPGQKGSEGSHRITTLHIDTTGTMFLVAMRPTKKWHPPTPKDGIGPEAFDTIFGVINTRTKQLLAAGTMSGQLLPAGFFGYGREGYRISDMEDGRRAVETITYELIPRDSSGAGAPCL